MQEDAKRLLRMDQVLDQSTMEEVTTTTTIENNVERTQEASINTLLEAISSKIKAGVLPERKEMNQLTALIYKRPVNNEDDDRSDDEMESLEEGDAETTSTANEGNGNESLMSRFAEVQKLYKEFRTQHMEEQNSKMEENLQQKRRLLEQMEALLTSTEEFSHIRNRFKEIRDKWKEIGNVPAPNKSEILAAYQKQMEQFYEINAITHEFREYDFAKNKEEKEHLIALAHKLEEDTDVVKAFNELQHLHDIWKETGPVAPEFRETMWQEFKVASTVINKRHQDYFTALREKEKENLEAKKLLCEQIEALKEEAMPTDREGWNKLTNTINELTEKWKSIGFAPKKNNAEIFRRFRNSLNEFYLARRNFYKGARQEVEAKIQQYRELTQKAEELKESTEWNKTTDLIIQLQKEWKVVGGLGVKVAESNRLWHRFSDACNEFFNRKQQNHKSQQEKRINNLDAKREVIRKIEALADSTTEDIREELNQLKDEWQSLGHVPNKYKDETNDAYYTALRSIGGERRESRRGNNRQRQGRTTQVDVRNIRVDLSKSLDEASDNELIAEYKLIKSTIAHMEEEIKKYDNNLGFFFPKGFDPKTDTPNLLAKQVLDKIASLKETQTKYTERLHTVEQLLRDKE